MWELVPWRGGSLGAVPREARSQELNVAQHVTSTQAGVPGSNVAWEWTSCHPVPPPSAQPASLPPHWCHWRWILPGLAWGSRRPSRPGLHDYSPGTERRRVGGQGMGWAVLGEEGHSQGRQVPRSEKFHLSPCYPPQSPTA